MLHTLDINNNIENVELILAKLCRLFFQLAFVKVVNMQQSLTLMEDNVLHINVPLDNM